MVKTIIVLSDKALLGNSKLFLSTSNFDFRTICKEYVGGCNKVAVANTCGANGKGKYNYYKYFSNICVSINVKEFRQLLQQFNLPKYRYPSANLGKIVYFHHEV